MPDFQLRKFTIQDLDQLLQLFYDTVHSINNRDYSQEQINAWAPQTADRQRWIAKLTNRIVYVASINDQIIGFGDALKEDEFGEIGHIYTHKDFQGRGIATALLKKLEQELRELGVVSIKTYASITTKSFFEKQGYAVLKKQEVQHRSGITFVNYHMQKRFS